MIIFNFMICAVQTKQHQIAHDMYECLINIKEDVAQLIVFFVVYFGYNILTFESVTEKKN